MKKRMMMLLTTVALVMGLTACGDSTASTGNDAASNSTSSLVVEGTAEPTPEPTPEPTAEPTPVPTEVTARVCSELVISDGKYITGSIPTVDGEFLDTSKTIAEMFFYVPEGKTVTYEIFCQNMPPICSDYWLPGGINWPYPSRTNSPSGAGCYYLLSDEHQEFEIIKDDWEGDFGHGMTKEEWNSIFTLNRNKYAIGDEPAYWRNNVDIKISNEELIKLFEELINNYSFDQIYDMFGNGYVDWSTASAEYKKYIYFEDSFFFDEFMSDKANAAREAYYADSTGWVDYYIYAEDWLALTDEERQADTYRGMYSIYFTERYGKEFK